MPETLANEVSLVRRYAELVSTMELYNMHNEKDANRSFVIAYFVVDKSRHKNTIYGLPFSYYTTNCVL